MNWPKKIKELRERLDLTQTELARRLGATRLTVSNWSKGKFIPSATYQIRIKELLKQERQLSIFTEDQKKTKTRINPKTYNQYAFSLTRGRVAAIDEVDLGYKSRSAKLRYIIDKYFSDYHTEIFERRIIKGDDSRD